MKPAKKIEHPTGKPLKWSGPTGYARGPARKRAEPITSDNHYTFRGERLRARGPQ